MRIEVPYSLLVREGELAWSCGQCPLNRGGEVLAPFQLAEQTTHVVQFIETILAKAELAPASVGKLVVYHASTSASETLRMRDILLECFGNRPIIVPIGIPHFYYDGMLIEVDMHASGEKSRTISLADDAKGVTIRLVDGGEIVWVDVEIKKAADKSLIGLVASLRELLGRVLGQIDCSFLEPLAEHWFVDDDADATIVMDVAVSMGLAFDRGAVFAVRHGGDTLARGEITFVQGDPQSQRKISVSERDGISVCFRQHRRFFWAAGRCITAQGSVVAETTGIMHRMAQVLAENGVGFDAVVKASTHYVGGSTAEELHENMAVRNAYYRSPGPASTGLPVHGFPYSKSTIAIDVLGTVPESSD
jgi:enamine deaminase RidA (YjgF/YER057c/UK114 family)